MGKQYLYTASRDEDGVLNSIETNSSRDFRKWIGMSDRNNLLRVIERGCYKGWLLKRDEVKRSRKPNTIPLDGIVLPRTDKHDRALYSANY
ncbi:MAG: hypothetical protein ACRC2R_09890 [Xenococcaceae cyanobacterium]